MVYPGNHLRLVASGSLPGGEGFSWGLNLHPNFSTSAEAPDEVPQAVIDAVSTFHQAVGVTSIDTALEELKLNEIGPDGRYVSASETVAHLFDPPVLASPNTELPNQCALAITLRTSARRGLASTGRFYLPCLAGVTLQNGIIEVNTATSVALAATTFLNSLNTALDPWRVSVISDVRDGAVRPVTHVQVGRVIDTMRSRRTSVPEAYVTGAPLEP